MVKINFKGGQSMKKFSYLLLIFLLVSSSLIRSQQLPSQHMRSAMNECEFYTIFTGGNKR